MNASYLENVCFYLAARKVGAIFIPVNVRLVAREVEYIVVNSDTEYLVYGQEYETLVDQIRGKVPQLKKIICIEKEGKPVPEWAVPYGQLLESSGSAPEVEIQPEDEADIIYTSGTTGRPKGVVLTEGQQTGLRPVARQRLGFSSAPLRLYETPDPLSFFHLDGRQLPYHDLALVRLLSDLGTGL